MEKHTWIRHVPSAGQFQRLCARGGGTCHSPLTAQSPEKSLVHGAYLVTTVINKRCPLLRHFLHQGSSNWWLPLLEALNYLISKYTEEDPVTSYNFHSGAPNDMLSGKGINESVKDERGKARSWGRMVPCTQTRAGFFTKSLHLSHQWGG